MLGDELSLVIGARKPDASAAACGHTMITKGPADVVDRRAERMMGMILH